MRAPLTACSLAVFLLLSASHSIAAASQDEEQHTIAMAQKTLERMGLYHGTTNGTLGPQTRDALAAYQRKLGLPVTARLDGRTALALANPDLMNICGARHVAVADCLDAITEFQAHFAGSDSGNHAVLVEETCRDAPIRSECVEAVAAMDKWLTTQKKFSR